MTPIDVIASGGNLQMMKALIPYMKKESQQSLAFLVKFMELQNLMSFFKDSGEVQGQSASGENTSFFEILSEIAPYFPPGQREMMSQGAQMMEMMKLMQSMTSPENADQGDFLRNMLSPEQQNLFETYQSMFSEEENGKEPA